MADDVNFNTRKQKSFDYTSEAAKQLITVATAITVFSVTFNKEVASGGQPNSLPTTDKWLLITAWIYFLLSVFGGLLTIYSLAGQLDSGEDDASLSSSPSIWRNPVNLMMKLQQVSFAYGLIYTAAFGIAALYSPLLNFAAIGLIIASAILFVLIIVFLSKKPEETPTTFTAHSEGNQIVPDSDFQLEPEMKFRVTVLSQND